MLLFHNKYNLQTIANREFRSFWTSDDILLNARANLEFIFIRFFFIRVFMDEPFLKQKLYLLILPIMSMADEVNKPQLFCLLRDNGQQYYLKSVLFNEI